jgi:exodeoxyribonuclease V beta subunit
MNASAFPELALFATPLNSVRLIEASAGTGKTWTITGLYVRLIVEEGYLVEQILVVTYTKAATAELRERIRRRLAEALASMATGEPPDDYCRSLLERAIDLGQRGLAIRRVQTAIRNFDEAAIFTIHGFCQRVLKESAFESGMAFETELAPDESSFIQEIVDDFWRRETAAVPALWARYLAEKGETPDAWRQTVRPHLAKPYLEIVPIPERDDCALIERSFTDAYDASRVLWLGRRAEITGLLCHAATDKTLKNTHYRPDALPLWFADFDEYFAAPDARLPPPEKLAKLSRKELERGTAKNKELPPHAFFDACSDLGEAAGQLAEIYRDRLIGLKIRLIGECNAELPKRKSRLGLMSYDDLLNRLADALQATEGSHLSAVIRERYRAALIDEFQDTDPVQYRIFRAIYARGSQPVFFVGDPKQAIYAFRGADVFSYLEARGQAAAKYTLAVNQRSAPRLIAAVNALFLRSPNPFLLSDIDYPPVKAADKTRPSLSVEGDCEAAFRFALLPDEGKALSKETANGLAAQSTATEIVRLLNLAAAGKARLVGDGDDRPINGGDIAVLVPTHRQGALIQETLAQRGVPAVRQGQDSVLQSSEAMELERILSAIVEPQREIRIRSALATELSGLDAATLFGLQNNEDAWERTLYDFTRYREIWLGRGFMPMFRLWLGENGVVERLLRYLDGERRLTNLLHLAELLQVASRDKPGPDGLLGWFSRAIAEPEDKDESLLRLESDAERVKIVTIHTSKGLEYPIVFCPFLWDGNLWRKEETTALFHDPNRHFQPVLNLGGPDYEAHRHFASREKLAEKLRLLYVALTRAKQRCHVTWGWVSGMETSALAWLLHGPSANTDDPLTSMASLIKGLDHAAIENDVHDAAGQAPGAVAVDTLPINATPYAPPATAARPLQVRSFARPYLRPTWRMASFSALARGRHNEGPDYDPAEPDPRDQPQDRSFFAFPRGAGAGRCLHAIFEEWDFTSPDRPALERLVRRKLKAHAISEDWTAVVADSIQAALATDLDGRGLKLLHIEAGNRLAELEFTYPIQSLDVHGLKTLLGEKPQGLPLEFARAAESLAFERVNGYMKGFIDLTFKAKARYYILDYKSNWLGPSPQDYATPRLLQAMAREHYYLQYLIYCTALHRYLGLRVPDYDYEVHFGGVFYLFLRGMGHENAPGCGIFWDRPGSGLIAALDGLF